MFLLLPLHFEMDVDPCLITIDKLYACEFVDDALSGASIACDASKLLIQESRWMCPVDVGMGRGEEEVKER